MEYILQTNQFTKIIGGKKLVSNINLHVKKGEIYGFLGPNGAGKTTMMKVITNLWKPTTGDIEIFGEILTPKSYAVQKKIGSMIEFPTFYEHMTGMENLQLHCKYMGYSKFVLKEKMGISNFKSAGDNKFRIYEDSTTPQAVAKALVLNDVGIVSIGKHLETLEDYFLKLTGEVSKDVRVD